MAYTKRDIINMAFGEIGLAEYVFDLTPQQLESALHRLDAMMATWNGKGVRLGYPLPSSQKSSDLDQLTEVSDFAIEAMALNLAVRIAPGYYKTVSPDTKASAKNAYNQIIAQSAKPIEMQLDNMSIPSGAGNKGYRYYGGPFLRQPTDPLTAGPDSILDLES
jgi:hypothetical protein